MPTASASRPVSQPVRGRRQQPGVRRLGQRGVRVAALRADHRPVGGQRPAVGDGRGGIGGRQQAGQREHLPGQREGDLHQVAGPVALQRLDGFLHLDRVADRAPQRDVHPGQQRPGTHAVLLAEGDHRLGELARPLVAGHERAGADLDVEDERAGALGDLLGHDRAGDERDGLDRPGDVAQRVEPAVGGGQPGPGRADHAAGAGQHGERLVRGQRGAEPGDRLELVQGAAGVPEAAPGQLRHGGAARRDQRREDQADLVADPAGRVLVHGRPADRGQVEPVPRGDHGRGPGPQLGAVKTAEVDRHQQRGHLLVGDLVPGVRLEQPPDVVVGEPAARPVWPG